MLRLPLPSLKTVLGLLMALLTLAPLSGCRSRCSSDNDCVKACQCNGSDWCAVGLLCENTFCEGEEGIPCGFPGDTFCEKYGDSCGLRRCESEKDCERTCFCQATQPNNMGPPCCFEERLTFTCAENRLCEPSYGADCNSFCAGLTVSFSPFCEASDQSGRTWDPVTCPTQGAVAPAAGQ